MSAKIMAEVARHSQVKGSMRLILLELAYYVDDEGKNAYPSMTTLADRSGITERHVQRCLKQLEEEGSIAVLRDKEPGKRPRNIYTIARPWNTAQMNTDTAIPCSAQMNTDMFTDMFTDTMSVELEEEKEEKPCAHTPEERERWEWHLELLGLPRWSNAWVASMNGYLEPLETREGGSHVR